MFQNKAWRSGDRDTNFILFQKSEPSYGYKQNNSSQIQEGDIRLIQWMFALEAKLKSILINTQQLEELDRVLEVLIGMI